MSELIPELHWEDGLLMRPQHLQAFQRHCHGLIGELARAHSFGYGVRELKIREASIGNFLFEVERCEAIMPDGSVVISGETAHIPPMEFRHVDEDARELSVWLAIPLLNPTAPNIHRDPAGSGTTGHRYVLAERQLRDENSGSNVQPVSVRLLNGRLFVGQDPPQGHTALKLAELRKVIVGGEEGKRYELSKSYVPASLNIGAYRYDDNPVLQSIVRDIHQRVEQKNNELTARLRGRSGELLGEGVEKPATLVKLQATNSILPVLRQLAGQPGMHPFDVYLQLCRLVGDLAIFGRTWEPPRLPIYDHRRPLLAYQELKERALELLEGAIPWRLDRRPFEKMPEEGVWAVQAIPTEFLEAGVELWLGVQTDRDLRDVRTCFRNCSIVLAGDARDLDDVRSRRIPGVPCARGDEPTPAALRDRDNLVFVRLEKDRIYWPSVQKGRILRLWRHKSAAAMSRFYLYAYGLQANAGAEE